MWGRRREATGRGARGQRPWREPGLAGAARGDAPHGVSCRLWPCGEAQTQTQEDQAELLPLSPPHSTWRPQGEGLPDLLAWPRTFQEASPAQAPAAWPLLSAGQGPGLHSRGRR